MTTAVAPDPALTRAVLRHLDTQLASARRLLDLILRQGAAIRERDVEAVLARLAEVKTEMAQRETLDSERSGVLAAAGVALGIPGGQVTMTALTDLMAPAEAARATELSAELRGLLAEIAREHGINRALMRQELAFLDHLVRLIGHDGHDGDSRVLNVEA